MLQAETARSPRREMRRVELEKEGLMEATSD